MILEYTVENGDYKSELLNSILPWNSKLSVVITAGSG